MNFYQQDEFYDDPNMERQGVPYWFWWPFFPGPWFFPRPPHHMPRPPFQPGPRPPMPRPPGPGPRPPRPREDSTYL